MNYKYVISFISGFAASLLLCMVRKSCKLEIQSASNEATDNKNEHISTAMRSFSEREKLAIRRMIEGTDGSYSYLLINAYNDIFYSKLVEYQYDKDKSYLVFYRQDVPFDHNEFLEIENEIMEISLLISYLRSNGLIYLIENTSVNELHNSGGFSKDGLKEISMELDKNISKILFESLNHRIFVGNTLRELAAHDYKSIEERTWEEAKAQTQETHNMVGEAKRQSDAAKEQATEAKQQTMIAQKQTKLSYCALILSILSVIISVCASIGVAKYITMDVKVDSIQVEEITLQLKQIEERIDSVSLQLGRNQVIVDKDQNKKQEK